MAQFNLADYETVEERLRRFWAMPEHADARIVTVNHTTPADRSVSTWVVEARIYLNAIEQQADCPKATGWAFEVDGQGMAQKTAALETAETSAIGRCLANMNMSGNRRVTREEMAKAERGVTPAPPKRAASAAPVTDWDALVSKLENVEEARLMYQAARNQKAGAAVLDAIKAKVNTLG